MNKQFLVNICTGGRLGNHFFNFIWMIEISRLTGVSIINPVFSQYRDYFDMPLIFSIPCWPPEPCLKWHDVLCIYPFLNRRILSFYHHIRITKQWRLDEIKCHIKPLPSLTYPIGYIAFDWLVDGRHAINKLGPTFRLQDGSPDLFGTAVLSYIRSRKITLLDSACMPSCVPPDIVDCVRRYFKLKPRFMAESQSLNQQCQARGAVLIGLSIRQGDFRTWLNGSWFIEPASFKKLIRACLRQLAESQYQLIICSDENVDKRIFSEFDPFYVEPGPAIHLSYLMCCDYILGTANSTFIQMASFLGNVPFYAVSAASKDRLPCLSDFKVFGLDERPG